MPSPTMARGLLGHFLRGADSPATDLTPAHPIDDIFVLTGNVGGRAGGGGVRGGAIRHKILRYTGDGGSGAGGRIRDSGGATNIEVGAARRKTAETKTTAAQTSGRQSKTRNTKVSSNGAGGKYRAEGTNRENSADKAPSGVARRWRGRQQRRRLRPRGRQGDNKDADMDGAGIERKRRG